EKDFRARLRGAAVRRIGDDIVITLKNDALLSRESLSPRGRETIVKLAVLLRHYDHSVVQVNGYTDTAGPEEGSRQLTEAHAKAVADALVAAGVAKNRVSFAGYGSAHPLIATGPGKNEPRNRRIEVRVIAHPEA